MVRFYCDICGRDITDYAESNAQATKGRLKIDVLVSIDNVWKGGHVCLECIREACEDLEIKRRVVAPEPEKKSVVGKTLLSKAVELRSELASQKAEADVLRKNFARYLLSAYIVNPQTIAELCDEKLDRTGALLGYVRGFALEQGENG